MAMHTRLNVRRFLFLTAMAVLLASTSGVEPLFAERILVPIGKSTVFKTPFPPKRVFVIKPRVIEAPVVTDEEIILTGVSKAPDTTQIIIWDQDGNKIIHDIETFKEDDLLAQKFATLAGEPGVTLQIFPDVVYIRGMVDTDEKKARVEKILGTLITDRKYESLLQVRPAVTVAQRVADAIKIPTVKVTILSKKDITPTATDAKPAGSDTSGNNASDTEDTTLLLEGTVENQNDYIHMVEVAKGFFEPAKIRNLVTISNPIMVSFQAYILQIDRNNMKDLGINWGTGDSGGGFQQGIVNFLEDASKITGGAPLSKYWNPFEMNNLNRSGLIQARITALETANKAKVLANPKLIVYANSKPTKVAGSGWLGEGTKTDPDADSTAGQDPEGDSGLAFFESGSEEQVQTGISTTGVPNTIAFNTSLRLAIRDLFVQDNDLKFSVFAKQEEPSGGSGTVKKNKRSIMTTVKMKNGETLVLGGLINKRHNVSEERVPGLHRIPWLGRLFKFKQTNTQETELVVLLTPEIMGREKDPLPVKKFETVPVPRRSDRLEKLHTLFQKIQSSHFPEEAGR